MDFQLIISDGVVRTTTCEKGLDFRDVYKKWIGLQKAINYTTKSKKIKNGDTTFAAYRRSVDGCKIIVIIFYFQFWRRLFYPRDAMLARVIVIATCPSVRPSVYPSVCPARAGIVSKQRKLASWFLHHLVAPGLSSFLTPNFIVKF